MLRFLRRTAVLLVLLVVGLSVALRAWNARSLPQLSGEVALAGLDQPVQILRDGYGVPHIFAKTDADMMFALGYVHAQDRLYQMEFQRRVGTGQVAGLWGAAAVPTDRYIRTLGFGKAAERTWDTPETLSAGARADLSAYALGVNAYIAEGRALPPEFTLAPGELLGPWREPHSLAWLKVMALDLGSNFNRELSRLYMAGFVDEARITDFYTPYPGMARFELPDLNSLYGLPDIVQDSGEAAQGATEASLLDAAALPQAALPHAALGDKGYWPVADAARGSNNWGIHGRLMESGAAVLANDPHLGLGIPGVWYFAHISSEESGTNAIGATLPGVPAIIIGRNDHIAWGFTNTGPDVQDAFIERISRQTGLYETPTGWEPLLERTETIAVAGGDAQEITIRATRHGPLLSDILSVPEVFPGDNIHEYGFALQWPTIMESVPDTSMNAAHLAYRATSFADFREAMAAYIAPQQNMVVLENASGTVGYIAPGKVPVRKPENLIQGWAPSPGWDATYDWDGFIAYQDLPQIYDPADGYIITANSDIRPPDYGPYITRDWSLPLRRDRIAALTVDQDRLLTMADMEAALFDQRINAAALALPAMLDAVDVQTLPEEQRGTASAMIAILQDWAAEDYSGASDEIGPSLFFAWYRDFVFGATLDDLSVDSTPAFNAAMYASLFRFNPQQALHLADGTAQGWCDCPALLAQTLISAHQALSEELGERMDAWAWGKLHRAVSSHAVLGGQVPELHGLTKLVSGLDFEFDRRHGGGPYSVNVSGFSLRDGLNFDADHTASLRLLVEAGRFDEARFVHTQGQSGHPQSPHFTDMADLWAANDFAPMHTDPLTVGQAAVHTLTLRPKVGD